MPIPDIPVWWKNVSTPDRPILADGYKYGVRPDSDFIEIGKEEDLKRSYVDEESTSDIYYNTKTGKYLRPLSHDEYPLDTINVKLQDDKKAEIRKRFKYIGGKDKLDTRKNAYLHAPKLRKVLDSLSKVYNINPKLLIHRVAKEGLLDAAVERYNEGTLNEQKAGLDNIIFKNGIIGFEQLGLDDAGTHLENGDYNMRWDATHGYRTSESENEKGRKTVSFYTDNPRDALEVMAADLEYRRNKMRQRFPKLSADSIDVLTNAAFNLGENHKDLSNFNWVFQTYKLEDYNK